MRIMGLKDSVHWLTWFVLCTTVMIITAILLVLILKVYFTIGKKLLLIYKNLFVYHLSLEELHSIRTF